METTEQLRAWLLVVGADSELCEKIRQNLDSRDPTGSWAWRGYSCNRVPPAIPAAETSKNDPALS